VIEEPKLHPIGPAAATLIEQHIDIVDSVVQSYRHKLPPWTDFAMVRSGAHIGLIEAARRYDPAQATPFQKWAQYQVRRRVHDELRRHGVYQRARHLRVQRAKRALESELARPPLPHEIAARIGLTPKEYRVWEMRYGSVHFVSLDEALDDNLTYHDLIADERENRSGEDIYAAMWRCVGRLSPSLKERIIETYVKGIALVDQARPGFNARRATYLNRKAILRLRKMMAVQRGREWTAA
jgi:DNA-directed RNA polymerase specialized sigma subunit